MPHALSTRSKPVIVDIAHRVGRIYASVEDTAADNILWSANDLQIVEEYTKVVDMSDADGTLYL